MSDLVYIPKVAKSESKKRQKTNDNVDRLKYASLTNTEEFEPPVLRIVKSEKVADRSLLSWCFTLFVFFLIVLWGIFVFIFTHFFRLLFYILYLLVVRCRPLRKRRSMNLLGSVLLVGFFYVCYLCFKYQESILKNINRVNSFWNDYGYIILLFLGIFSLLLCILVKQNIGETDEPFSTYLLDFFRFSRKSRKKYGKEESKVKKELESILGVKFKKVRPDFLKNPATGKNLELDMYNPNVTYLPFGIRNRKIGVEYNGEQHYKRSDHFHQTDADFAYQEEKDKLKARLLEREGVDLIVVPYWVKNYKTYLTEKLKDIGRAV